MTTTTLLPKTCVPQAGEALLAWLMRLSALYSMAPRQLLHALNIGAFSQQRLRQPNSPLAAALGQEDLIELARRARCDPSILIRCMPIGAHWALKDDHLASVCSDCVALDRERGCEPYQRREWREAWCTLCLRHRTPLVLSRLDDQGRVLFDPSLAGTGAVTVQTREAMALLFYFQQIIARAIRGVPPPHTLGALSAEQFLAVLDDVTSFVCRKFSGEGAYRSLVILRGPELDQRCPGLFGTTYHVRRYSQRASGSFGLMNIPQPAVRRTALWLALEGMSIEAASVLSRMSAARNHLQRGLLMRAGRNGVQWLVERAQSWPTEYTQRQWHSIPTQSDTK